MSYLVCGRERAPTTGQLHWQGYCQLSAQRTFKWVLELMAPCHVETCYGNATQNRDYCLKSCEDDYFEWGEMREQGFRRDLQELHQEIMTGRASVSNVLLEQPQMFHQYGRTLLALEDLMQSSKQRSPTGPMPTVIWIYGPTGSGKSRLCWEKSPDLWSYQEDRGWWDTYQQQDHVLFDDLRADTIPWALLLRLLDRYPVSVSRRARAPIPFVATRIYITCPQTPEDLFVKYQGADNVAQLLRRITYMGEVEDMRNVLAMMP